jgi:hypothetical protein
LKLDKAIVGLDESKASTEDSMQNTPLTSASNHSTVDAQKLASFVIDKQAALISELQAAHVKVAHHAAALAQAVKLAQDGAIDVSDIDDHARQLIHDGSVKLSAADDLFDQTPGELITRTENVSGGQKLDPLTRYLREVQ